MKHNSFYVGKQIDVKTYRDGGSFLTELGWVTFFGLVAATVFCLFLFSCSRPDEVYADIAWDSFSNTQIVSAIYHAEGGSHAKYPYGVRSIKVKYEHEAYRICYNSVRNGRARWIKAGKPDDLIIFIGKRYCPPSAHALNTHWVKNVKYFLNKGGA